MGRCGYKLIDRGIPIVYRILLQIPVYPQSIDVDQLADSLGIAHRAITLSLNRMGTEYLVSEDMTVTGRKIYCFPTEKMKEVTLENARRKAGEEYSNGC